jgi:hypothetical protein
MQVLPQSTIPIRMTTPATVDGLRLRRVMGRERWGPPHPHGPDGWWMRSIGGNASVIVTVAVHDDGRDWIHASIARSGRMPDYDDLSRLHRAAFGDHWAYQVFAPRADHVNIHEYALHLWGRADGANVLPNFGGWGSI